MSQYPITLILRYLFLYSLSPTSKAPLSRSSAATSKPSHARTSWLHQSCIKNSTQLSSARQSTSSLFFLEIHATLAALRAARASSPACARHARVTYGERGSCPTLRGWRSSSRSSSRSSLRPRARAALGAPTTRRAARGCRSLLAPRSRCPSRTANAELQARKRRSARSRRAGDARAPRPSVGRERRARSAQSPAIASRTKTLRLMVGSNVRGCRGALCTTRRRGRRCERRPALGATAAVVGGRLAHVPAVRGVGGTAEARRGARARCWRRSGRSATRRVLAARRLRLVDQPAIRDWGGGGSRGGGESVPARAAAAARRVRRDAVRTTSQL